MTSLSIRWIRNFGPFTPAQAIQMIKILKRAKAVQIHIFIQDETAVEPGRFVEATIPCGRVPDMRWRANAIKNTRI